jgi:hypothetical protein
MSQPESTGWPRFGDEPWPWQQALRLRRQNLQDALDKEWKPQIDALDDYLLQFHDKLDGEHRQAKRWQQKFQGHIKFKETIRDSGLRNVANRYMAMDEEGWSEERRERVYEAVGRYVYGIDKMLKWEGCEEDEEEDWRRRQTKQMKEPEVTS